MNNRVIAIIEDDRICRLVVRKQIESNAPSNTKVLEFEHGQTALSFFIQNCSNHEELPDVIFLDLSMPIMDGWELLEELSARLSTFTKVPQVFILTSSSDQGDKDKASHYPMVNRFITKPVNLRTIQRIVNQSDLYQHRAA